MRKKKSGNLGQLWSGSRIKQNLGLQKYTVLGSKRALRVGVKYAISSICLKFQLLGKK